MSNKGYGQGMPLRFVVLWALSGICWSMQLDMTHKFNNDTIYWIGFPSFQLNDLVPGHNKVSAYSFSAAEHGGTHIDAPMHFFKDKWTVDEIPISRLSGPAVIIDISEIASQVSDAYVTIQDLLDWESQHGDIPPGAIVLMNSGWERHWPNKERYLGGPQDPLKLHFPGFSAEACSWLVDSRDIVGLGVDTVSFDPGNVTTYTCHNTILGKNIWGLENVMNLGRVPAAGAQLLVMPMNIEGGSGGPSRVIATWDTDPPAKKCGNVCASSSTRVGYGTTFSCVLLLLCAVNSL